MALRKFTYHDPTYGYLDDQDVGDSLALGGLTVDTGNLQLTGGATLRGLPTTPTNADEGASKSYVDNQLSGLTWKDPVSVLKIKDDQDQGGSPPTGVTGEAWVVNNWGVSYNDGDIVEYDGASWNVIVANSGGEPPDGTRVLVDASPVAGGSFAGQGNDIGTYDATGDSWSFDDAVEGWALIVTGEGSIYENTGWTYDNGTWIQFTGAGQINAGNGLDKTGNTIFVGNGNGINVLADSIEVDLDTTSGGSLEFLGVSPDGELRVRVDGAHGIVRGATGLELELDETPDTLDVDADGLKVVGLPSLFKVNDIAVGATVTAANLDDLTDGSNADALHTHNISDVEEADRVEATHTNAVVVATGEAVRWSGTNDQIQAADNGAAATARCIGVARVGGAASPGTSEVVKHGVAVGVLTPQTDVFVVNDEAFLGASGAIRLYANIPKPGRIIRMGFAKNANDLDVQIMDLGRVRA